MSVIHLNKIFPYKNNVLTKENSRNQRRIYSFFPKEYFEHLHSCTESPGKSLRWSLLQKQLYAVNYIHKRLLLPYLTHNSLSIQILNDKDSSGSLAIITLNASFISAFNSLENVVASSMFMVAETRHVLLSFSSVYFFVLS